METTHQKSIPEVQIRAVKKHPLALRWMHWLNFPFLGVMIWSGLAIYWADSAPDGTHAHQVYRIGLGSWTLARLFPDWLYIKLGLPFQLATGLSYHFTLMWFFALNGVVYVIFLALSGQWRLLVPRGRSWREAWQVVLHDLGLRKTSPPAVKYNGAQRIAYSAVILMGAGMLLTGLAIYKPVQLGWLTRLLGGYEMARWFHFWITMGFILFFVVHVAQVARAGWSNFRSMVTGLEPITPTGSTPEEPETKPAATPAAVVEVNS
jgi:thiosulfate reductase cytochrome b subunit